MDHFPITRTAFFRFYEELNDFLQEEQRKTTFSYEFIGTPSVKDSIEAIGVPHTEIDVILINGESVDFDYRMQGGEYISVYPVFESFDIISLVHLRSKPLREIRFVVDVNLGKLARKLRLLGFDTMYNNNFKDEEIVKLSLKERRIILTRDKGIFKYRAVTHGYWIRNNDPKKQLTEVVKRMQLENSFEPFIRCSNCNELLNPIDKELIKDRLPKLTFLYVDDFMECKGCRKIYWKGSHYEQICKLIDELKVG
ncbi:Ubiquitin and RNAse domains-containing [Desulfonema limicola]|uniref:Ubiquitin and RNAse domains-containing n=1 Tax=Desulfonema limicola TaxID=45656 RepID=A0A975B434_9BACT|nr:Mut7-C RNAse domain-containing protein [Desulfonema limicola]QTA78406.1 Ubiquitin and RNAse domains-containing [Desulfonema limicola]